MVILVPPDSGPVDGWTRVKYGDYKVTNTQVEHDFLVPRRKSNSLLKTTSAYHKGEGLGGHRFVVGVNAVPHTHLHLSLLHPVACCIVEPTHNPAKKKKRRDEFHHEPNLSECTSCKVFFSRFVLESGCFFHKKEAYLNNDNVMKRKQRREQQRTDDSASFSLLLCLSPKKKKLHPNSSE